MDLQELRAANIVRDQEWVSVGAGQRLSLSFRGNELAGKIGEACNILKKLERERLGLVGSRSTLDDLAEELADGVICIDLIAMDTGIDLGASVERKFNKTSVARGLTTRLTTSAAIRDVVAERRRQFEIEGFSPVTDDEYISGELAQAASSYAMAAADVAYYLERPATRDAPTFPVPDSWPWGDNWWKPGDARRMLVKATALLIAEIERLDRKEALRS